ncbi:NDUS5 protein, partial [Cercotrichas coryphoeus]|nr:NDUS5 protein [Cercotrichas coryphoeus]
MPFWGLQKQLGIDVDSTACHAFEGEWVECRHGLGQTCTRRECRLKYGDFMECMKRTHLAQRLWVILEQWDSMIKQGEYTPPDCHTGKDVPRP